MKCLSSDVGYAVHYLDVTVDTPGTSDQRLSVVRIKQTVDRAVMLILWINVDRTKVFTTFKGEGIYVANVLWNIDLVQILTFAESNVKHTAVRMDIKLSCAVVGHIVEHVIWIVLSAKVFSTVVGVIDQRILVGRYGNRNVQDTVAELNFLGISTVYGDYTGILVSNDLFFACVVFRHQEKDVGVVLISKISAAVVVVIIEIIFCVDYEWRDIFKIA